MTTQWRLHGVRVVRAGELDTNTAQTPGMSRAARARVAREWRTTLEINSRAAENTIGSAECDSG